MGKLRVALEKVARIFDKKFLNLWRNVIFLTITNLCGFFNFKYFVHRKSFQICHIVAVALSLENLSKNLLIKDEKNLCFV